MRWSEFRLWCTLLRLTRARATPPLLLGCVPKLGASKPTPTPRRPTSVCLRLRCMRLWWLAVVTVQMRGVGVQPHFSTSRLCAAASALTCCAPPPRCRAATTLAARAFAPMSTAWPATESATTTWRCWCDGSARSAACWTTLTSWPEMPTSRVLSALFAGAALARTGQFHARRRAGRSCAAGGGGCGGDDGVVARR